jgi:cytochrome c
MRVCVAAACVLIGGCADSLTQTSASTGTPPEIAGSGSSILDGVFSYEQSRRGEALYLEICVECHEKDLAGGGYVDEFIPPLVGEDFLSEWAPWTVGDLFEYVTTEMPPEREDRHGITANNYTDILAYVLERNGFPAGQSELPPEFDPLVEIEMRPAR